MEQYIIFGTNNIESFIKIMEDLQVNLTAMKMGVSEDILNQINQRAIEENVSILAVPISLVNEIKERIESSSSFEELSEISEMSNQRQFTFLNINDKKEDGPGVLIPFMETELICKEENEKGLISLDDITDLKIALNTMDVDKFIESI